MLSIIIPAYNEEKTIQKTLEGLSNKDNIEVIVVDGGSHDRTVALAKQHPVMIARAPKNRALQMNEGAKRAKGDAFLFLHADCLPEEEGIKAIRAALENGCVGGCLRQRIQSPKAIFRWIETSGNLRAKLFKIFYGDQAIFARRDVFFQIGGFDNVDLFDDVIFSKKLKRAGKVCIVNKKVYTSARRWQRQGIVKTTLINWLLTLGCVMGISPSSLKKFYSEIR